MVFKTFRELEKRTNECIKKALEKTKLDIYRVVWRKIMDYYNEPVFDDSRIPEYDRTYRLINSLKGEVVKNENTYSVRVGWDDDYLEYTYPGWEKQYGRGTMGKNKATGADVLGYVNQGMHGGWAFTSDHHFLEEANIELESMGGVPYIFKKHLKATGLPII